MNPGPAWFKRKVKPAQRTLGWYITAAELRRMWERQNGRCGITGQPLTTKTATIDHIVPIARGGSNDLDNLRWANKTPNHAKGNLLDDEFVLLCRQVIAHLSRTP